MSLEALLRRPIHHLGYIVDDIHTAVDAWAGLGVGPFYLLEHAPYEEESHLGEPCRLDHTAAFSHLGDVGLELHQVHSAEPPRLAEELGCGRGNGLNHIAYVLEDPAAQSDWLSANGYPQTFYGVAGPVHDYMHFVPSLGHVIELHVESEQFAAAWGRVAAAAADWDGSELLRRFVPPH